MPSIVCIRVCLCRNAEVLPAQNLQNPRIFLVLFLLKIIRIKHTHCRNNNYVRNAECWESDDRNHLLECLQAAQYHLWLCCVCVKSTTLLYISYCLWIIHVCIANAFQFETSRTKKSRKMWVWDWVAFTRDLLTHTTHRIEINIGVVHCEQHTRMHTSHTESARSMWGSKRWQIFIATNNTSRWTHAVFIVHSHTHGCLSSRIAEYDWFVDEYNTSYSGPMSEALYSHRQWRRARAHTLPIHTHTQTHIAHLALIHTFTNDQRLYSTHTHTWYTHARDSTT